MAPPDEHHRAPAIWLLAPFIAGLIAAPALSGLAGLGLVAAAIVACAASWLIVRRDSRSARVAWAVLVCSGAFAAGVARMGLALREAPRWRDLPPREATLELEITRVFSPAAVGGRQSCLARVVSAPGPIEDLAGQRVFLALATRTSGGRNPAPQLLRTMRVDAIGVLSPLRGDSAPGGFDEFLWSNGVRFRLGRAEVVEVTRGQTRIAGGLDALGRRFETILRRGLPEENTAAGAYVAMFLGRRSELSDEQREGFIRSGTMHLFAISGLHIGLIAISLFAVLSACRLPERWAVGIGLAMLLVFVEATGGSPSARRAFLMVAFMYAGTLLRRPANLLAGLALSALVVLVLDPLALRSVSFQLSYAVVATLLLYGVPLRNRVLEHWNPWPHLPEANRRAWHRAVFHGVRGTVVLTAVSLSATMVSAPLSLAYFGIAAPGSVLANLVVVPVAWLAITAGFASIVCGLAGLGPLSSVFNNAGALVIAAIDFAAQTASRLPGMFVEGGFASAWIAPALTLALITGILAGYAWGWRRWRGGVLLLAPPVGMTLALVLLVTPKPRGEESASMKSAYELAMERLRQADPDAGPKLNDEQKARLAEIDRVYQGRIAEREIFLKQRLAEAGAARNAEDAEKIRQQLGSERERLEEEREAEKNKVRRQTG
jgi:competence protein ComEC